jgi:glycosyltransferase involved in cell wall biosynthesis
MAEPARVVHLTTVHHPLDPRIYWKQARSLASAGYDVWLLARGEGLRDLEDVRFVPLPNGNGKWSRVKRQRVAWSKVREIRPQVLHIHDPELLPLAWRLRSAVGCKVIYDKHEAYSGRGDPEGKVAAMLESWAFRWVDHVILAEEAYQSSVEATGAEFTVVLNYALPVAQAGKTVQETPLEPLRLVYTGTISRGRGLFDMLHLADRAKERGYPLAVTLVGICNYPDERLEADRFIRDRGLSTMIEIEGWDQYASPELLRRAQEQAHVGLMLAEARPNYVVSVPTKFYEYIQYGLALVVSDIPLWKEFVLRNGCGIVVDPTNPDALLEKLIDLIRGDSFLETRKSALHVSEQYVWDKMEVRLFSAYERTQYQRS